MQKALAAVALFAASLTPAFGSIIDGSALNIFGQFRAPSTSITFDCSQSGDTKCSPLPAGAGDFGISGSTGTFSQYNGSFGLIRNISNALQPLNQPFSFPNFLTFDLNSNETVTLTFLPLGVDSPSATCAGLLHCTPQSPLLVTPANPLGLSGFNLDSIASGTTLTFSIKGVLNDSSGQTATLSGSFQSQFAGLNPQQTLAFLQAGQGNTFSASLVATSPTSSVPEPGSLALLGSAVGALAVARRRSSKRAPAVG